LEALFDILGTYCDAPAMALGNCNQLVREHPTQEIEELKIAGINMVNYFS
jgi:hypothetical protein